MGSLDNSESEVEVKEEKKVNDPCANGHDYQAIIVPSPCSLLSGNVILYCRKCGKTIKPIVTFR